MSAVPPDVLSRTPHQQYIRRLSCVVGTAGGGEALDFSDFRVVFDVRRGDRYTPNTCDIVIYNPSNATAAKIRNEFTQVVLKAGYEGAFDVIFQGNIVQVRFGRENQLNSYVAITAADGDEAYNFSTIGLSLEASQTLPVSILQNLMKNFGPNINFDPSKLPTLKNNNPLPRGVVCYGQTRDFIRQVAEDNDCQASIQDGQLTFVALTEAPAGQAVLVTPATGLIGVPEQTQNGLRVRTLLNPALKVTGLIQIKTTVNEFRYGTGLEPEGVRQNLMLRLGATQISPDGFYYIMAANHSGDTRGTPWYTDLTCLSLHATTITPGNVAQAYVVPAGSLFRY